MLKHSTLAIAALVLLTSCSQTQDARQRGYRSENGVAKVHASALADLSEEQALALRGDHQMGVPLIVEHPTYESLAWLEQATGLDGLTAMPLYQGSGTVDSIGIDLDGFYPRVATFMDLTPNPDGADSDPAIVEETERWLVNQAGLGQFPDSVALLAQDTDGPVELDRLLTGMPRDTFMTLDHATHKVIATAWGAFSEDQEASYIVIELSMTSSGANFSNLSAKHGLFGPGKLTLGTEGCRGDGGSVCLRDRYLRQFAVQVSPVNTQGVVLVDWGPDSVRVEDSYTLESSFSLGGKVTAGWKNKEGPSVGGEISAGVTWKRSETIKIPDATMVATTGQGGENNAGWRFEFPTMRGKDDLSDTPQGGPSDKCQNLISYPFPVQRGSMKSKAYVIYEIKDSKAYFEKTGGFDLNVKTTVKEESSALVVMNGPCNVAFCNCDPRITSSMHKSVEAVISFPPIAQE